MYILSCRIPVGSLVLEKLLILFLVKLSGWSIINELLELFRPDLSNYSFIQLFLSSRFNVYFCVLSPLYGCTLFMPWSGRVWFTMCLAVCLLAGLIKQAAGGRPPRYAHALLLPPCGRRSASRGRADGNVAAVSHGRHVPTPTAAAAWCANTAVSKAAWWRWPLTFCHWKWCPSHVWRGLPL